MKHFQPSDLFDAEGRFNVGDERKSYSLKGIWVLPMRVVIHVF